MVKTSKKIVAAKATAKRAMTLRSLNKRLKNVESNVRAEETKKFYLPQNETQLLSTSGPLTMLNVINPMIQGDLASNIDGVSYSLRGIAMRFLVHNTTGTAAIVRIAVVRAKSGFNMTTQGESLLLGTAQNGLDYAGANEYQRYYCPINTKKYDVIMQRTFKLGAKNSTYTSNIDSNKIIRGYKSFKNRKEFVNAAGNPDTPYYIVGWCVDTNMDFTPISIEVTGETTFYYKDN